MAGGDGEIAPPPAPAGPDAAGDAATAGTAPAVADTGTERRDRARPVASSAQRPPKRRGGGTIAGVLLLLLLVLGGGFLARDQIADATGVDGIRNVFGLEDRIVALVAPGDAEDEPDVEPDVVDGTGVADAGTADGEDAVSDGGAVQVGDAGDDTPPPADPEVAEVEAGGEGTIVADGPEKFTQQLTPDGEEVDVAPRDDDVGTTAVQSSPVGGDADGAPDADTTTEVARLDDTTTDPVASPDGARAFLVREPVGNADPERRTGGVTWSVVEESPGGELPPEPAIRGEVTLPDGTGLELTLKRNGETSLPASHLITIIFASPDGEEARVDELALVGFKDSLQVAARPLIAVPAKITDEIFLVGLNNLGTAIQSNLELMGNEAFMDMNFVFANGRRATLTLEKGEAGEGVFAEVLSAWESTPLPG